MSTDVHVCWSREDWTARRIVFCPTCKQRRRFAGWGQEWYGTIWTCCGCGDAWCDGEMLPRPFARGWRAKSIRKAKALWDRATRRGDG
jgi:hypothetical protein